MPGRLTAEMDRSGKNKDGKTGMQPLVPATIDLLWNFIKNILIIRNYIFFVKNYISLSFATIPIRYAACLCKNGSFFGGCPQLGFSLRGIRKIVFAVQAVGAQRDFSGNPSALEPAST